MLGDPGVSTVLPPDVTGPIPMSWPEALEVLSAEIGTSVGFSVAGERQLLERLKVPFKTTTAIFRPGRFARGDKPVHELRPSHQH